MFRIAGLPEILRTNRSHHKAFDYIETIIRALQRDSRRGALGAFFILADRPVLVGLEARLDINLVPASLTVAKR